MPKLSLKEEMIDFIKSLPDNLTAEEITYRLYVSERIKKAQKQIKEGDFVTHEEAKDIMKKWLK